MSKKNEKTQAVEESQEVETSNLPDVMDDQETPEVKEPTIAELLAIIEDLKASKGKDRKAEILGLIKEGFDTSQALAEKANITTKNVASILTALRKEGNHLLTMKVGGQNVIKLLTDDEARTFGLI